VVGERVAVVGAGPVGAALTLLLAESDVPVVLLDVKPEWTYEGSKAMVFARHSLELLARLGCPELVAKAVVLDRARTYYRDTELFCRELPPTPPGQVPQMGNLQQSYVEQGLLARCEADPRVEVRWGVAVEGLEQDDDGVTLELGRGERLRAPYAVGCDGPRSAVRKALDVEFDGRSFPDRFLITDIRADLGYSNERRFYFDPPWNPGRQVLIHPEPDGEWRMDWQVPADTDMDAERANGGLDERIRTILGPRPYEVVWATSYRFHERLARRFRVGRVLLAGDAAHLMSPFGARGLNSGFEDAVNLGWRLPLVLHGVGSDSLLDEYEHERMAAARENLRVTSRTMRFLAPPSAVRRLGRNAVLRGSLHARWLRRFVDSGKLAEPAEYGRGPVGRLCPPADRTEPLEHGFSLAEVGGKTYLVRPDGYVAEVMPADPVGSLRAALAG
jgi:2-polyprenyl-6-methoxyphenol hydroxylase-like FAD-dependent oxidoreductase